MTIEPLNPVRREVIDDQPPDPSARLLSIDLGLYGHRGAISSFYWYAQDGALATHFAELLPDEMTVLDQMDYLEAVAESYPEYWRVPPVVVIGATVLSHVGKRQVRQHLDSWYSPPWLRRLVSISNYAGEQNRVVVSRKRLRDVLADRLAQRNVTLTVSQVDAVAAYTGKREPPGRDDDDEWRWDETDAIALPVALAVFGARTLLPQPAATAADRKRALYRAARAWQFQLGLSEEDAVRHAQRHGHPRDHGPQPAAAAASFKRPRASSPLRTWKDHR